MSVAKVTKLFGIVLVLASIGLQAGEKIDQVLDVTASGQVKIENMRGVVKIIGWDKNQVSVSGELDDKATGYTFESENGFTEFKVRMPKHISSRNWKETDGSRLKIYLPMGSDLSFESVNGDVSVIKVSGGSSVHTVNGNIKATGLSGHIQLETVNGHIKAYELDGKIKLATVNGEVSDTNSKGKVQYEAVNGTIESNTQARRVFVENVNGEIDLNLHTIEELDVTTVNGEIDASLGLTNDGTVNVTTVSGDARLRFVGEVGGKFRLKAHAGGRIKNRLTEDKVKKQKYGPASSLKFSKEGGNSKIDMTTVSGNLIIESK